MARFMSQAKVLKLFSESRNQVSFWFLIGLQTVILEVAVPSHPVGQIPYVLSYELSDDRCAANDNLVSLNHTETVA